MQRMNFTGFWRSSVLAALTLAGVFLLSSGRSLHAADGAPDAHSVPVVDGALGSCSAEFTVKDRAGKPVYAAKIRVHIAYGFVSAHKLDLEVGTNVDGKGRFEGLPNKVKRPLHYEASEGDREGSAVYDPADNCKAVHEIVIAKPENASGNP